MASLALLTMDRGDRKVFMDHCVYQAAKIHPLGIEHIQIVYPPKSNQFDLTERVKKGWEIAKENGIEWLVIMESDDYYAADHVLRMWDHFDTSDFIGSEFTYYHNLKNRTWERSSHPNHSSLFTTAFRVSAMKDFKWHIAHKVFLDLDIWRYAKRFRRSFVDTGAIGIKHGIGLCGGRGHRQTFANKDPDLAWLKSKVDEQSFEFYKSLSHGLL